MEKDYYDEEDEEESEGFIMVFKKCKCGSSVGCMMGDGTEDGNLIDHSGCKLKKDAKGGKDE